MKKILDNIFSDTGEFVVRFIFAAVFMSFFISNCLAQTTFTDEEVVNLENQFLQLEFQVDSLSTQDSLKTLEVNLLNKKHLPFLVFFFQSSVSFIYIYLIFCFFLFLFFIFFFAFFKFSFFASC